MKTLLTLLLGGACWTGGTLAAASDSERTARCIVRIIEQEYLTNPRSLVPVSPIRDRWLLDSPRSPFLGWKHRPGFVSVVIPTYREWENGHVFQLLRSFLDQAAIAPRDFQLVFVVNHWFTTHRRHPAREENRRTVEYLRAISEKRIPGLGDQALARAWVERGLNLQVVDVTEPGTRLTLGRLRELGVRHAESVVDRPAHEHYYAMFDADTVPPPFYLRQIQSRFDDPEMDTLLFSMESYLEEDPSIHGAVTYMGKIASRWQVYADRRVESSLPLSGAPRIVFRGTAFHRMGNFPDRNWEEDWELVARLKKVSRKVDYVWEDATVTAERSRADGFDAGTNWEAARDFMATLKRGAEVTQAVGTAHWPPLFISYLSRLTGSQDEYGVLAGEIAHEIRRHEDVRALLQLPGAEPENLGQTDALRATGAIRRWAAENQASPETLAALLADYTQLLSETPNKYAWALVRSLERYLALVQTDPHSHPKTHDLLKGFRRLYTRSWAELFADAHAEIEADGPATRDFVTALGLRALSANDVRRIAAKVGRHERWISYLWEVFANDAHALKMAPTAPEIFLLRVNLINIFSAYQDPMALLQFADTVIPLLRASQGEDSGFLSILLSRLHTEGYGRCYGLSETQIEVTYESLLRLLGTYVDSSNRRGTFVTARERRDLDSLLIPIQRYGACLSAATRDRILTSRSLMVREAVAGHKMPEFTPLGALRHSDAEELVELQVARDATPFYRLNTSEPGHRRQVR